MKSEQRTIVDYLKRFGACDAVRAETEGWTRRGLPAEPLRALINARVVAPRVLTSYPLRVMWELKATAHTKQQAEARQRLREKLREFAYTLKGTM